MAFPDITNSGARSPNHMRYAPWGGGYATQWQAMATFHEVSRLDCRGLLRTVAQYLFRNKVGGKWLSFRFLDADLPPTASKRYDFVKD